MSWWSASRQVVWATLGCLVVPFLALVALYAVGLDVSDAALLGAGRRRSA